MKTSLLILVRYIFFIIIIIYFIFLPPAALSLPAPCCSGKAVAEEPGGFRGRLSPGEEQPRALPAHNSFSLERGRVLQPPLFSRRAPAAFFPFAIIILVKQKGKLCTIWIMLTIAYLEPVFSPPSFSPAFFSSLRSGLGL